MITPTYRPQDYAFALALCARFLAPRPTQPVSEWVEQNIVFDEPKLRGPFTFTGREYLRDCLNDFNDPQVRDVVDVFGTGAGKTITFMSGMGWRIAHEPVRALWVMPATHGAGGAQNFSKSRFKKMILATPALRDLIPKGVRLDWTLSSLHMEIGGSIIDFVGSNSAAQLAANRCDIVIQDEVDKFNEGTDKEANASYLADERTKGMPQARRFKSSSPTTMGGLIWQELMKSDMQRRFMPCPHCGKFVVLAWSKQFTVFKLDGREAFVKWDKEAKLKDGWDLERVVKSARYECPHCGGHIRDGHKAQMDRNGRWEATRTGAPFYRGRHLPSMYAQSFESNVGQMAKKFLLASRSLTGMQGFINSDLAEPYLSQDTSNERIELISTRVEVTAEWTKLMTIDCQQKAPYYRALVRAWNTKETQALRYEAVDTTDDLRAIQSGEGIKDACVAMDSGFHARSGEADVYATCAGFCEAIARFDKLPLLLGWLPAKGFQGSKRWKDENGLMLPYHMIGTDPFLGKADAGRYEINLLEFATDYFKDILANMRVGKGPVKWSVCDEVAANQSYWNELDAEHKVLVVNRVTGFSKMEWRKKHRDRPNEAFDCEIMQEVLATFLGLFALEEAK